MAKKGGTQQLQLELNSDEDLENFLVKSGLIVLDIYTDWCGQCLGLVSALRKVKLEIAGDNLSLGIAKADNISHFKRFTGKSEPTWMFIVNGKTVNIAFGSDQPKLTKLLIDELNLLNSQKVRKTYELSELLPVEIERNREADEAKAAAELKEAQEKAQKRLDYLNFVTDTIMENLPDAAVTVFGTYVGRDMVKKVLEAADGIQLVCKDRKFTTISKEEWETINYHCPNPLPKEVQDLHSEDEALVCYWKLPDGNFKVLQEYAKELTKVRTAKTEEGEMIKLRPLLKPANVKVLYELEAGEPYVEPPEPEPDHDDFDQPAVEEAAARQTHVEHEDLEGEEGEEEEEEGGGGDAPADEPPADLPPPAPLDFDLGLDDDLDEGEEELEEEEDVIRYGLKYVRVNPIWIPSNHRTHAALVYTLFHSQTTSFLPPDPVPDPPHIIMAFDPWRSSEVVSVAKRNTDKIPIFGYFTSDDMVDAEFIARSQEKYDLSTKSPDDRLVLRVNKVTSHMMLSLATYNPTYVSPSTEIGAAEAKVFFPEDIKTESKEQIEIVEEQKRLRKMKKGKKGLTVATTDEDEGEPDDDAVEGAEEGGEGDEYGEFVIEEDDVYVEEEVLQPRKSESRKSLRRQRSSMMHPPEEAADDEHGEGAGADEGDGEGHGEGGEGAEGDHHRDGDEDEDEDGQGREPGEATSSHKIHYEDSQHEGLRADESRADGPKGDDDAKKEEPKKDEDKADEPKKEEEKAEEPKKEEPKPDEPKPDEPKPADD